MSLGAAAEARPLCRLSVWADDTFMTAFEVDCVRIAGERADFEVAVFERTTDDIKADFKTFYEDPSSDVLWVIGHGKFEAHSAEGSGLQFDLDTVLSWDELGQMTVPEGDRRLLVLNVCSGAEVKVTGGVARIGIGPELAGTYQTVVGHQWAVDGGVALAFGALAASELAQGQTPLEAFRTAIGALRHPETVIEGIRKGLGDVGAIDRLQPDTMTGLLNWGCPIILT